MRSFAAPVLAALASSSVGLVQLVRIEFDSGDVLLNTSNQSIVWDGLTYLGAGELGTVSAVQDQPGEAQGLSLQLAGGSSAYLALALDASDQVQGARVSVRTAIVDTATYTVLDAPLDWVGRADAMSIQEDGDSAVITLAAESNAVDLLRGNAATFSHADQQARHSGDRAFEYVVSQADQPVIWPSREFFYK